MVKAVFGIILLVVGGSIYLLQRTTSLVLFQVVDGLGLTGPVNSLRASVTAWPEFVVFSLPGGLWSAAYVLITDAILLGTPLQMRMACASLIPLLGLASEVLQWTGLCPGTADWQDVVCYVLPYIMYVLCLVRR